MFAGNDTVQFSREGHDARDRRPGFLQHRIIVGIDRNIGVNIAVSRVHMQGNKHAAVQHLFVDGIELFLDLCERAPRKYFV